MKISSIILFLFLLLLINGCTDNYTTENDPTPSALNKGPIKPPPPPPPPVFGPLDLSTPNLIAACAQMDNLIKVYKVEGSTYTPIWSVTTTAPTGVAIGNIDGDQNKELIGLRTYMLGSGKNASRKNDLVIFEEGSTGEIKLTYPLTINTTNQIAISVFTADIDGVDYDEVIVVCQYAIQILKYVPEQNTFVKYFENNNLLYFIMNAEVTDLEKDGDIDILCSSLAVPGHFVLFLNNGNGNFTSIKSPTIQSTLNKTRVCGDVDGDGLIEIIGGGTNNQLNIWKYAEKDNLGNTINEITRSPITTANLGDYTMAVTSGDFDGDGKVELATAAGNNIFIFEYPLGGPLQPDKTIIAPERISFMHTRDNKIGIPDMICSGSGMLVFNNYEQIFRETSDKGFNEICIYQSMQ